MSRKKFDIPVGWTNRRTNQTIRVMLPADTPVLIIRPEYIISPGFDVVRVSGTKSPHIPEKRPRYRIEGRPNDFETGLTVLRNVAIGHSFLISLLTRRVQTCMKSGEFLHGVYMQWEGLALYAYCGKYEGYYGLDPNIVTVPDVEPTCEECLKNASVWHLFNVLPYEDPAKVLKRQAKAKQAVARHLRKPTAYARVMDDELFENPSYKPTKIKLVPDHTETVDETEEFEDARERKLASSIERNRRWGESKAR